MFIVWSVCLLEFSTLGGFYVRNLDTIIGLIKTGELMLIVAVHIWRCPHLRGVP